MEQLAADQHSALQDSFVAQKGGHEERRSRRNDDNLDKDDNLNALRCYLSAHRININVRQVLSNGINSITEEMGKRKQ